MQSRGGSFPAVIPVVPYDPRFHRLVIMTWHTLYAVIRLG